MSPSRWSRSSSRRAPDPSSGPAPAAAAPTLTGRDRGVVGVLLLAFAAVGAAIATPTLAPAGGGTGGAPGRTAAPRPDATPPPEPVIRIGVLGSAASVNPLTASTRAERDLASLVFGGLVRLSDDGGWEPDLAETWSFADGGRTWTFELDPDARWHDGIPVTASDVVFTVDLLRDPDAALRGAASWGDVSATAVDEDTVRFELGTPIGGFLEAARQPLLPAHLLEGVTAEGLVDHPFGRAPVGTGPYRLMSLDPERAVLEPVAPTPAPAVAATPSATTPDSLATQTPPGAEIPPDRPARLELVFDPDPVALEGSWTTGVVDVVSGLPPEVAVRLESEAGADARLVRYPTTTLTAVLLNQRVDHPELRDRTTRRALLQGIDRAALVTNVWSDLATPAVAPIPPLSWAFDDEVSHAIAYDRRAAALALDEAGWTPADGRWTAPDASEPYTLELVSTDLASNAATFEAAASVAADLRRVGLTVDHVAVSPTDLIAERLRPGAFDAAVVDVNVGLDPDLYPLLASSQIRSSGLNLSGVVDPALDRLLVAARTPASTDARTAAWRALQERLAEWQYMLPLAFRDEVMLVRNNVAGISPRLIGDPGDRFHDVLAWRLADGR